MATSCKQMRNHRHRLEANLVQGRSPYRIGEEDFVQVPVERPVLSQGSWYATKAERDYFGFINLARFMPEWEG
ncbi:hypothetical protein V3C99_017399 [Haemonchus contortus]